jgi:hypothetical protein
MLEKLKSLSGKLDKPALLKAIALMIMSWAALPIIYWLIVRKKKAVKEPSEKEEKEWMEEIDPSTKEEENGDME